MVLAITGSAAQAGLLLGISTGTYLLVGLIAGALVDRWNRKRTMVWCEVGRAALTATVPIALLWNAVTLPQLYAVAVATGVLTVLFQTANSTALPNIVRQEQLPAALGATHAASSALGIVGAAIAGAAYALGRAVPFAFNAISFVVSALALRSIRAEFQEDDARPQAASARQLVAEIRQGLAWVWGQPVVRLLTVVEAADGLRYGAGYLIIIELARHVGADSLQVGLVFPAPRSAAWSEGSPRAVSRPASDWGVWRSPCSGSKRSRSRSTLSRRPGGGWRVSPSWKASSRQEQVFQDAKSAYLVDLDSQPDPATSFARWVGQVLDRHNRLTPERRAQVAKALGGSRRVGTGSLAAS